MTLLTRASQACAVALLVLVGGCAEDQPSTPVVEMPPVTSGLIVYLPLDGTVVDAMKFIASSEITVSGSPLAMPNRAGKANSAMAFDGVDDIIQLSASPVLQRWPLTYSLWLRRGFTIPTGLRIPMGKYLHPSGDGVGFIFEGNNVGALYTTKFFANYCRAEATFPDDGGWHHLAFTLNDTEMLVYIDGVLEASTSWSGDPTQSASASRLGLAMVESLHPTTPPVVFKGELDDIAVYDRALSADEIMQLSQH